MTKTVVGPRRAYADPEVDEATAAETDESADEPSGLHQVGHVARELVVIVVGALIVCSLLRFFVGQMFIIPSPSMESTLLVGDRVVVQKITDFKRGDIVVFADPGGWLRNGPRGQERGPVGKAFEFVGVLPDTSTGHLVKRVIGMPGDKVICCDKQGRITVNGQALDETSYLYRDAAGEQVVSAVTFEVVVPKGRLFVMGDHREESADSRCHLTDVSPGTVKGATAFVPVESVVGPAPAIVLPINRAQRLHRPETFATVPAAVLPAPDQAVIKPDNVHC